MVRQKIVQEGGRYLRYWTRVRLAGQWRPWTEISGMTYSEIHAEWTGRLEGSLVTWTRIIS